MHRDLKPENVLLDEKWHTKVVSLSIYTFQIDFGDAKFIDAELEKEVLEAEGKEDEAEDITRSDTMTQRRGTFVGTPYYVSPEMLDQEQSFPASDLWALGCIIFRMVTGQYPF